VVKQLVKKVSAIEAGQGGRARGGGEAAAREGSQVESKDDWYRTPLSRAAENRHDGVVKLLLKKAADVERARGADRRVSLSPRRPLRQHIFTFEVTTSSSVAILAPATQPTSDPIIILSPRAQQSYSHLPLAGSIDVSSSSQLRDGSDLDLASASDAFQPSRHARRI
jgi:hypothetical protein